MKNNLYAVILAGGAGTRFWPLSRKTRPKQFLNIAAPQTLLQATIARIRPVVPSDHIYVVTGALYERAVASQLKAYKVPRANILLEPSGKNTAPAICWAAARIQACNKNAVMAVLPSDHLISNPKAFLKKLNEAAGFAEREYLVTMGIVPTRPETGYGYLKTARVKDKGRDVTKVVKFTEKPSLPKARQFVRSRNYLWNSGMFIWKTGTILEEFKQHLPEIHRLFKNNPSRIANIWSKCPSISIDYGILEKSNRVVTVRAQDIGWSDLGSWEALWEILPKDPKGNIFKNDVIGLDCRNTMVFGDQRLVAAIGLDDCVIVDTPDALLVCRRDLSQKVKDIVTILAGKKRGEI